MSTMLQNWWDVTSKIRSQKTDFWPANLFSLLHAACSGEVRCFKWTHGKVPQEVAGPASKELRPSVQQAMNNRSYHQPPEQARSRSTCSWLLRWLQAWPVSGLQTCESPRTQLDCTQMVDPQTMWDSHRHRAIHLLSEYVELYSRGRQTFSV